MTIEYQQASDEYLKVRVIRAINALPDIAGLVAYLQNTANLLRPTGTKGGAYHWYCCRGLQGLHDGPEEPTDRRIQAINGIVGRKRVGEELKEWFQAGLDGQICQLSNQGGKSDWRGPRLPRDRCVEGEPKLLVLFPYLYKDYSHNSRHLRAVYASVLYCAFLAHVL